MISIDLVIGGALHLSQSNEENPNNLLEKSGPILII